MSLSLHCTYFHRYSRGGIFIFNPSVVTLHVTCNSGCGMFIFGPFENDISGSAEMETAKEKERQNKMEKYSSQKERWHGQQGRQSTQRSQCYTGCLFYFSPWNIFNVSLLNIHSLERLELVSSIQIFMVFDFYFMVFAALQQTPSVCCKAGV